MRRIGGPLADRMTINVAKRLRHIDRQKMLAGFVHRDAPGYGDAAWLGEHAGKFLDAACRALAYAPDAALRALADECAATTALVSRSSSMRRSQPMRSA